MVFFNYATMQMAAKIVYYGPGLCGKTTNLHVIYGRTAPTSRGEMVSLETETDRTLFFDLLPLDVGVIGGFKTRLQLYTVPGQVFYNTTRKLVLKGVDGIVFVADSQRPMLDPNKESLKNLRENLAEIGITLDEIPRVYQYNKRDLANIATVDEMNDVLNVDRSVEWYEASARNGTGVFETLKAISKLTLRFLRGRMTGDAKRPTVVVATPTTPIAPVPASPQVEAPRASLDDVRAAGGSLAASKVGPPPIPAEPPPIPLAPPPSTSASGAIAVPKSAGDNSTMARLARFKEIAATTGSGEVAVPKKEKKSRSGVFDFDVKEAKPEARPIEAEPFGEPAPEAAGEINFGENAAAPAPQAVEPAMKHVRVRSNVDILSELDKLRKIATQKPTGATGAYPALSDKEAKSKSSPGVSIDDLLTSSLNHKKDIARSFDVAVPKDALQRSRSVTIGLRFADESGVIVGPERSVSVDLANLRDIQRVLLSLRINLQGE